MKIVYVTGCLGFIGSYVTRKCLERGWMVYGIDKCTYAANKNLLEEFTQFSNFTFLEKDIKPKDAVEANKFGFQKVINMIPPNVRLVVNDVFTQSTGGKFDKVFTEKNLNRDYKTLLKDIALDVLSQGKTNIEYADYKSVDGDNAYADVSYTKKGIPDVTDKRFNLKTALGQAEIKIDRNGNLVIVDRFNFNDSEDINSFTDFYQMVKEIGGSALQGEGYNLVRKVAKWFGSSEGEGQNVRINLGKVDLSKFKDTKIARLNLAKGDTPSRAWMRDYYFDGKGGYDTFMSFEEFALGPGKDLYLKSKGKNKGGVIRKNFRYGGDTMGGRNDRSRNSNRGSDRGHSRFSVGSGYYGETRTSNKGGDNGGSSSNNNNNTSNNTKNSKTDTKDKRKTEVRVGPFKQYSYTNPVSIEAITNPSNVSYEVSGGIQAIGPTFTGKAYLSGSTNLKSVGDINKSFNIDFENQKGFDVNASYDLNNSILSGNVSKYTDIGNTGYKVGVGVDYNDGDIGPSFQIKKSFKRGGLLDKKRG